MSAEVYDRYVTKRTNINLDTELLREAAELLGTERITDTVHAAMREVVDREYRRRLANRHLFTDVTPRSSRRCAGAGRSRADGTGRYERMALVRARAR